MNKTIKMICYLGAGIALYFVLGCVMNIPLLAGSHLQTDLGYIAFGAFLYLFGTPATIVGAFGCALESALVSGWVPIGWMLGQLVIGAICGTVYKETENKIILIVVTVVSVFLGIGLVKTFIECFLYQIPFAIKFAKNLVAFIADTIPMLIGLFLGIQLKNRNILQLD